MNLLILAAVALSSRDAAASIPDLVGEGPANIGMGSAGTALANDAYAPYYNPAGLTQQRRITLGAAPIMGQKCLLGFDGVVQDMNGDGRIQDTQGYPEYGSVSPSGKGYNPDTESVPACESYGDGIEFGLVVPFWRVAAFGISGYLPSDSLIHVSLSDPAMPSYFMYGNRNRTFAFAPAFALNPVQGVHLGLGFQLMANIAATAELSTTVDASAFSSAEDAAAVAGGGHASVDALDADIKPQLGLNWGLLVDASVASKSRDPEVVTRLRRHAVAVAYRGEWMAGTSVNATANVHGQIKFQDETLLLSSLVEEPIQIAIEDLVGFYNPAQMSFGFRTGFGDVRDADGTLDDMPRFQLSADATLTGWGAFQDMVAPYLEQSVTTIEGVTMTVTVGEDLGKPNFQDTLSYRAGMQVAVGPFLATEAFDTMHMHLRLGGQYVPSPIPDQTGRTNYMDSDRIVGAAGIGIEAGRLKPVKTLAPLFNGPLSLDLGGQVHYLIPHTVQKDGDLVSDSDSDGIPEYPRGYPLGGQITSYGIYWAATAGLQFHLGNPQVRPRPVRTFKEGPLAEPGPNPEKAKAARDAGAVEEANLAIPVNEAGKAVPPDHKKTRAEKKAEKAAAEAEKKAAEAGVDGASPDAVSPDGASPDGASPDGAAPEGKKEKKKKKAKKGDTPDEAPAASEGGDAIEDLDAPDPDAKKKDKAAKKKDKKKKGEDAAPTEPTDSGSLPEASDEPSGETP